jgi:hypothetical protein
LNYIQENSPVRFWEIQYILGSNDLAWIYLRNLRSYGLIEKTEYGWSLTQKGKAFLQDYNDRIKRIEKMNDKFTDNNTDNLPISQPIINGKVIGNLTANLSAYNNNSNTIENNNIKNIENSSVFASKSGILENNIAPSFSGLPNIPIRGSTHTFSARGSKLIGSKKKELFLVADALTKKYGDGATISSKLVKDTIISTLVITDERSIKNKLKALISIGFLLPAGEGLFKVRGGVHEAEKVV